MSKKIEQKPLVAIQCITYNHEPYIRDALEGFAMQKTNFPFVAIVHDDASTDKTAEIIREYAEKYPDIIKPIFETENQYSKKDGSLGRIMKEAIATTRAKYIAMCEGDDYWTDPLKLQKQVDFLESNPDYGMCYSDFDIIIAKSGKTYKSLMKNYPTKFPSQYQLKEFVRQGGYVAPPSWLFRSSLKPITIPGACDGTFVLFSYFLANTKVFCFNESMVVYRILEESATHFKDPMKLLIRSKKLNELKIKLANEFNLGNEFINAVTKEYYKKTFPLLLICKQESEINKALKELAPVGIKEKTLLLLSKISPEIINYIRKVYKILIKYKNPYK